MDPGIILSTLFVTKLGYLVRATTEILFDVIEQRLHVHIHLFSHPKRLFP